MSLSGPMRQNSGKFRYLLVHVWWALFKQKLADQYFIKETHIGFTHTTYHIQLYFHGEIAVIPEIIIVHHYMFKVISTK